MIRKRLLSLLTALALCAAPACTAESGGSFLDSLGSFFSDTWSEVSQLAGTAWEEASQWVENAWGDASRWVEQAWNTSSGWVTDIWGDVSSWAGETWASASGSVSAWWTAAFDRVTDSSGKAWSWLTEESGLLKEKAAAATQDVKAAVSATGGQAGEQVRKTFDALLARLDLTAGDADRVWRTVEAYAREKGISTLAAAKLALPCLLQLTLDAAAEPERSIPAIAIAQYLTAVMEKLGVQSDSGAEELLRKLSEALNGV